MAEHKTATELREDIKPTELVELGEGLELWKIDVALLLEQDLNARVMTTEMFNHLSRTIGSRKALESFPFCALTGKGLELVSGHHRVRAARKAEILEIWVIVDVTGLTPDQIKAKQLAHNSIQGSDNEEILYKIFNAIADAEYRIEAYIMPDLSAIDKKIRLESKDLDISLDHVTIALTFLPSEYEVFKKAIGEIEAFQGCEDIYLAQKEEYELLRDVLNKVGGKYNIRAAPTIFAKMADIVNEALGKDDAQD